MVQNYKFWKLIITQQYCSFWDIFWCWRTQWRQSIIFCWLRDTAMELYLEDPAWTCIMFCLIPGICDVISSCASTQAWQTSKHSWPSFQIRAAGCSKKKKSLRLNHAPGMMAEYSNTHNFFHTVTHNRKFVNFSITPHTCTKIDILDTFFFLLGNTYYVAGSTLDRSSHTWMGQNG